MNESTCSDLGSSSSDDRYSPGLELARVPRMPGTRGIYGQCCMAPADYGNFTT